MLRLKATVKTARNVSTTTSATTTRWLLHSLVDGSQSNRNINVEMARTRRRCTASTISGVHLRNNLQHLNGLSSSSSFFTSSYFSEYGGVRCFTIKTQGHNSSLFQCNEFIFNGKVDFRRRHQYPTSFLRLLPYQRKLLSSQVAQSAAPLQNDNNGDNNIDEDVISRSRRDHDRRVAEVQAKIKRKQEELQQQRKLQEEQQQQNRQLIEAEQEEESKQVLTTTKEQAQRRKPILQSIRIWLAKEPKYYESTMDALKQTSGFALKNGHNNDDDVLGGGGVVSDGRGSIQQSYLSGQVKALYVDTIGTFLKEISKNPTPSIRKVLQQLDDVGFGDVEWNKNYRMTRSYYVQKREFEDAINLHYYKVKRNQSILESIQMELDELLQQQQQQQQRLTNNRDVNDDVDVDDVNDDGLKSLQKLIEHKQHNIKKREKHIENMANKQYYLERKYDKLKSKDPPLTADEFQYAEQIVENVVRDELCLELANHIQQRHQKLLDQYQLLDNITDLTKPHEWDSLTRQERRKIVFHGGPTNSGKTYQALQRLREADTGLYLAPLRLLAAEVYETLTAYGITTNLYTGQEKREVDSATHAAATIEMASTHDTQYDVVVLDEIQMIADESRGAAWTRALLALRCKEIHVCGGLEAQHLIERIVESCGDDFEVITYDRYRPLQIADESLSLNPTEKGCYSKVQPGDCVVAFSRRDIFAIKREIETNTNYKCCVIYGKLPPETRADQARRFNDPESGYDILVASDAIGMGLNLNIRRVIFNSLFKFNGADVVRIDHSTIKQIAGRAGRRNSPYPDGVVTCRDPRDMVFVRNCLERDIAPIEKAGLLPTPDHIESFHQALQTHNLDLVGDSSQPPEDQATTDLFRILRQFSAMATIKGDYFLCRKTEMERIARQIKDVPLPIRDSYTLCLAPISDSSDRNLKQLESIALQLCYEDEIVDISKGHRQPSHAKTFDDLGHLCGIFGDVSLSLWIQFKFPSSNSEEIQEDLMGRKDEVIYYINEALNNSDSLKLSHCYLQQADRYRKIWERKHRKLANAELYDGVFADDNVVNDKVSYS